MKPKTTTVATEFFIVSWQAPASTLQKLCIFPGTRSKFKVLWVKRFAGSGLLGLDMTKLAVREERHR